MTHPRDLKPRRRPLQERSLATVSAILEAAAQVFARHGYAAGTTNRIAERAGVSIGTLYQYFPNKDALLVAIAERHISEAERLLRAVMTELIRRPPPLRDGLQLMVSAAIESHRHEPRLHRVLFEEAPRPPALRARFDQIFDSACHVLAQYLESRPEVHVTNSAVAAQLVVQSIEAITHGLVIHPRGDAAPDAYSREAATMLERYLTAHTP
jgi:AcrR family transcriptional regulator